MFDVDGKNRETPNNQDLYYLTSKSFKFKHQCQARAILSTPQGILYALEKNLSVMNISNLAGSAAKMPPDCLKKSPALNRAPRH